MRFTKREYGGGVSSDPKISSKSVEDLGIPAVVASFAERPNGLVLVTGPTGSGKSTTLAALIDKVNSEKRYILLRLRIRLNLRISRKGQ